MVQDCITIPQNSLMDILRYQPESVLIELFDKLLISSDTSPLTEEEKIDISNAKQEYYNGETIAWKK
jgi:hypothetical protein